jgi:hypothetical protein
VYIDLSAIVGATVTDARVGWHRLEDYRSPVLLHLAIDGRWLEVCTPGDGSLRFCASEPPHDYDMAEAGRFEFIRPAPDHPVSSLIGKRIERVQRLIFMGTDVGLLLVDREGVVVLANEWDEIFASRGALPGCYVEASQVVDL